MRYRCITLSLIFMLQLTVNSNDVSNFVSGGLSLCLKMCYHIVIGLH